MSSVLDHYNPHSTNSRMDWPGSTSSKFGRTKAFLPKRDLIDLGFSFPSQDVVRGRRHSPETRSPQKQFRSTLRIIPKIQHWHPRESSKKMVDMSLSQPHARRERSHQIPRFPPTSKDTAGIRTFYNLPVKMQNQHNYYVQDKMQRKHRVDLESIRNNFTFRENPERVPFRL